MFNFASDDERIAEAELLLREDDDESHDRSVLSSFYSGRPTMSEDEAAERGVAELTNHLFGFDALNMAKMQVYGIYDKDPNLWQVDLQNVDPFDKQRFDMELTQKWNEIMKQSQRFKGPWKGVAGDTTLFGQASLMWLNPRDWCPKLARPLVPRGVCASADALPYFFLPHYLTVSEMERIIRIAEETGGNENWKIPELIKAVKMLTGNVGDKADLYPNLENTPNEELEQMSQNNSKASDHVRLKLPVFYCYERNSDGTSFDLTIITRIKTKENTDRQRRAGHGSNQVNVRLFHQKQYYASVKDLICPFFLDCNIGGETMWHRVMGLGRLNFENDVDIEEFFNEAMQGSKENVRRMYQVGSGASTEMIERWNSDPAWSNILPEGISIVEAAKNPNYQHAFQIIQMLGQNSKGNAGDPISNTNDKATNELEVQAIARQSRNSQAVSGRQNDIYDNLKITGETVWSRFCSPEIIPGEEGYTEIAEFQDCVRELGLSPEFLGERTQHGRLRNARIRVVRSAGDGDRVREVMVNRALLERLALFGPDAQKVILHRVVASETQDPDFADAIVPRTQRIAFDQEVRANNENDKAMLQGINGVIPEIRDEDSNLDHIPIHLQGLAAAIAHGKSLLEMGAVWPVGMIEGFRALGAHAMQHIQAVAQIPEQRVTASQFTEQLQALSREADLLISESAQRMQQQQANQEISAKDQAELELKARKQQLSERAQLKLEDHREDALNLSRRKQGFEESARDEQLRQSQSQQDLNRAVAIDEAGRKDREEQRQEAEPAGSTE